MHKPWIKANIFVLIIENECLRKRTLKRLLIKDKTYACVCRWKYIRKTTLINYREYMILSTLIIYMAITLIKEASQKQESW